MTEKKAADVATEAAAVVETEFAQLMGAGWKRVEQMDAISKAVLARIQEERAAEVQLGLALLQCPTPADAFILYTKWLTQRTTAFMEDAPKLASLWTELYAPKKADEPPPLPE